MNKDTPILQIKSLRFAYGESPVLQKINFQLQQGQRLGVAGASGSGKSTLLKIISGRLSPQRGQVLFEGRDLAHLRNERLGHYGPIALMNQDFALDSQLTADENIVRRGRQLSPTALRRFLGKSHRHLRIGSFKSQKVKALSGGQQQRVALAAALVSKPQVLLLDEPFSQVDFDLKQEMLYFLENHCDTTAVIMVGHEPADLLRFCPQILVLDKGKVLQKGDSEQVYHQPKNLRVAQLTGLVSELTPSDAEALGLRKTFFRPGQASLVAGGEQLELLRFFSNGYARYAQLLAPSGQKLIVAVASNWSAAPGSRWGLRL